MNNIPPSRQDQPYPWPPQQAGAYPGPYPPQPPPYPGPYPQPGPPPAPPGKKKGKGGRVALVVLLLIIGTPLAIGLWLSSSRAAYAMPGDCAAASGGQHSASLSTVDCGSPEATHRVAIVAAPDEQCPTPDYSVYTETRRGADKPQVKLCLVPILAEGQCYDTADQKTACPGSFMVVKVVEGQSDAALCDATTSVALTYPEPKVTYCVVPA